MAVEAEFYNDNLGVGINNGDFGYFDLIQEQQQPMMTWQQHGFQFPSASCYQDGGDCSYSSPPGGADVAYSQSVASLLDKQRQDFGWALQIQNERLRKILTQKYEPYITALISQKDETISMANKKKSILENYLRTLETEIATWQVKAGESKAKVAELNNALSQLRARNDNGDEESHCDSSHSASEKCKLCKARRSCVVFLPCRHLCSCKFCGDFVGVCPVCATVKVSSVEVLFD